MQQARNWIRHFGPGIALGLFLGRILSEWLPWHPLNGWPGALALTAVALVASVWLLRQRPLDHTWPALLLLGYVLYPEPDPAVALVVALTAVLAWILQRPGRALPGWAGGLVTALAAFALYVITLAPDLLPADNGEFQLIATELGVAHPPGFPLYTVLAHAMTRLPLGPTPAWRVNLFAALTSALTIWVVYTAVFRLTHRHAAGVIAAVALGSATTFWAQSTTANIRSLTALFAALMFWTLIGFYQAQQDGAARRKDRWLTAFALVLGLGVGHHASLAFIGLVCGLFVLWVDPAFIRTPRRWWRPLLALLLGLLPLLYLPLRATADVRGASPGLATLDGFLNHALALGFRGDLFYFITPAALWERFKVMGNVLAFQFHPLLLAGMLLATAVLLWRDRKLALLLVGSFALHTFITATYRAPQTVEYMLPAYVAAAVALGTLLTATSARPWAAATAAILLAAGIWQTAGHWPSYRALAASYDTRVTVAPLLAAAPPGSTLLAHWHWATPLWYLQEVEGQRPDVSVRFVFPEGASYEETWARRTAAALAGGQDVIATAYFAGVAPELPLPEPLGDAYWFRQTPRSDLPDGFTPLQLTLGGAIEVLGYALDTTAVAPTTQAIVTLAWQPAAAWPNAPPALFAHLIAPDGQLVAQADETAVAQPEGITLTQLRLVPRPGAAPGDYGVAIGAYGAEPMPDAQGLTRTPIAALAVTAAPAPLATQHPTYRATVATAVRRLVGYDWDSSLPDRPRLYLHWQTPQGYQTEIRDDAASGYTLPPASGPWGIVRRSTLQPDAEAVYVPFGAGIIYSGGRLPLRQATAPAPGAALTLTADFLSSAPLLRDYAVSMRLIGFEADGFLWAWWDLDDSIPAMGAIPTLKWVADSAVSSPHFVTVSPEATAGQRLGGALTLYDAFTLRPLAILDERLTAVAPWVPLGEAQVAGP